MVVVGREFVGGGDGGVEGGEQSERMVNGALFWPELTMINTLHGLV